MLFGTLLLSAAFVVLCQDVQAVDAKLPTAIAPDAIPPPVGPARLVPSTNRNLRHRRHLSRRHRRDLGSQHAAVYADRQVQNGREAHRRWVRRDEIELERRSTPSNVPAPPPTCSYSAAAYAQCGGVGYTGDTCCVSGYTCVFSNSYYSQCVPGSNPPSTTTTTPAAPTPTPPGCTGLQSAYDSQCVPGSNPPSTTTTTPAAPTPTPPGCTGLQSAYGQCGGQGYLGATCCPTGYICSVSNPYYSQCVPVSANPSSSSSSTTTSSAPQPTPTPQSCNPTSGGSDGCTPYTVTAAGVALPAGQTYQAGGHVNYIAIPKSEYVPGETYLHPGSNWTPQSFGVNFDPNNGQPGGVYIGKSFFDFGLAAQAFPQGYCIIWVQLAQYNQHYGEGGQAPVCT
ncbi:hypothetical protein JCM8202v2_002213 [Rhodotorula sphaerocarpa]